MAYAFTHYAICDGCGETETVQDGINFNDLDKSEEVPPHGWCIINESLCCPSEGCQKDAHQAVIKQEKKEIN